MSDKIIISCISNFIEQQSDIEKNQYVFSYTITIRNRSQSSCQLISRHWIIQDANRKVEEVYGEGVVGEQPIILPDQQYTYTSGAVLETEIGTMEGRYFMLFEDQEVAVPIPKFVLAIPRILH